jgi:hypothetical protein
MNGRMYNIIISIFCIGIILFIFMTRCKVAKIQLKMKDASLILIFFALLAYINGHEILFIILLLSFSIIYFTPQNYFDKYLSNFLGKKGKNIPHKIPHEIPYENTIETVDTDIEIDDNITIDEQDQEQYQEQYQENDNKK